MIGPTVRRLRLERQLSQEALANAAHVSSGYLSKLERGVYKQPSHEVLSRIAGALSVPTVELYKQAGMDHLLVESDPNWESLLGLFTPKISDLPRRDREIILGELRRILKEESEGNK
ncbi:MAG TPA: helix-turn-helix transcriptional regulator [Chloroflexia bacterium]|jgi:transcriptional regulator with XRE-family HTH domain